MSDNMQSGSISHATVTAQPAPRKLEDIHRDVAFANAYRQELIKHTISLSTAIFVFTLAFLKDYVGANPIQWRLLVPVGWTALAISIVAGLGHMASWDRYYISYRDHWGDEEAGKAVRLRINRWRRLSMLLQFGGLGVGLAVLVVFYIVNF